MSISGKVDPVVRRISASDIAEALGQGLRDFQALPIYGLTFGALYAVSLVSGALGALLVNPTAITGGASGAVFGVMAASVVIMRRRGIDPMRSGFGGLLLVNLLLTFVIPGIAVGGHLGGLVGGAVAGALLERTDRAPMRLVGVAGCLLVGLAVTGAALWVAANPV